MKCQGFVAALIVAGLFHQVAHAEAVPPVECFSSPEAVYETHPGSHAVYSTHATWWTESSKCWFVGDPVAKPKTKSRVTAVVASPSSEHVARVLLPQPKQEVQLPSQESVATQGTYEENAAALRNLMFGPDESSTDFEGRFSAIRNTPTFSLWRRCYATPIWDLCPSST
jgi:hypothetical protein